MRKNKFLNLFLVCLIMANVLAACTNWDDVAIQRDNLVTQLGTEQVRMKDSKTEVKNRSGNFPTSYTQATESLLATANDALANIGSESTGWLGELNDAIQQKDKKVANDRLERIQTALDQIRDYTNKILGPPGSTGQTLYDILDGKVMLLHDGYVKGDTRDLLQETKDLDTTVLVSIQTAVPFALCGSDTQMSFKDARSSYGTGVAGVKSAEQFISEGDEPAASDALVNAYVFFNSATGSITTAPTNHQLVVSAIDSAENSQGLAVAAMLIGYGDYPENESSELSAGNDSLNNAYALCYAETFVSADPYVVTAMTEAKSAKDHFDLVVYWSTEEEDEDVYIAPSNDDNETLDPWSYDTDEADVPDDSPTWEFETDDSPTWEYETDDSPTWEFESDDSDTWEFESDDSDTWEYESDDSSAWDSALWISPKILQPLIEWIQQR